MAMYPCAACGVEHYHLKLVQGLCPGCRTIPMPKGRGRQSVEHHTLHDILEDTGIKHAYGEDKMDADVKPERKPRVKRPWSPEQRAKFEATRAKRNGAADDSRRISVIDAMMETPPAVVALPAPAPPSVFPSFARMAFELFEAHGVDKVEEAFIATARAYEAYKAIGLMP